MKNLLFLIGSSIATLMMIGCGGPPEKKTVNLRSPDSKLALSFFLTPQGAPVYYLNYQGQRIIDTSGLGFTFQELAPLKNGFEIVDITESEADESWEMPWGEQRMVSNHYREAVVRMQEKEAPGRKMNLYFRLYDDGLGFRYELPEQEGWQEAIIMDEHTQFQLTGDHQCWWIPGDWDIYEHLYNATKFSEIDALSKRDHPNLAQTYIPENAVNTPVTMRTADGLHLSFHEANLTNYSGMTLKVDADKLLMESELVGSTRLGYKAKVELPFRTPWRTVQLSETAAGLVDSRLILNLNEPNKLGDVSWFKPTKYTGIWWEMHLGRSGWDLAGGKHGATTEHAKELIDFSAANKIGAVLIEGWNTGWERWIGFPDREGVFDFVTPYEDYDIEEVVRYGKERGVDIIMHHETSAAPRTYEQQLDTAYALMKKLGMHAVKTGYVGPIIPEGEYHHGQWMVNHYRKVLETAARYQVAVNAHEPIKATGIRRTLPNAISREGLRGQEFNAFSNEGSNGPDHMPNVVFTRMLAGPIDFTPGAFKFDLAPDRPNNRVPTTLAQQLALYVVIYSPIQMACDLIENYEGEVAFQFIRDVGVDWEQSLTLNGEVGDYVTIAREERGTGNWFVGSITDEQERKFSLSFDFLPEGKTFEATIYRDGDDAHWESNPKSMVIEQKEVTSASALDVTLAPGGGLAISLMEK
jgi:hypothetical protein